MRRLRVGLVGVGLAGEVFHDAFLRRPAGAELCGVAAGHAESARAAALRWGVPRSFDTWRELIADRDLDAVCLATPTGTHSEIALAAAAAGKHVLTEKPMAATLAEADSMITAFHEAGLQLGVIFMYRYLEAAVKMKSALDQGLVGRVIFAECSVKSLRTQIYYDSGAWRGTWKGEGGGSLMTQASHTIDLLIWMVGEVSEVAGFWTTTPTHQIEVDDLAVASIRFANGALGAIVSSTAVDPPAERSLTIHGERGTIGLVGDDLATWHVPGGPDEDAARLLNAVPVDRGDTAATPYYSDWTLHFKQIEDFVRAVRNERAPAIDGREGRRAVAVMDAIYRSQSSHSIVSPA